MINLSLKRPSAGWGVMLSFGSGTQQAKEGSNRPAEKACNTLSVGFAATYVVLSSGERLACAELSE